MVELTTFTMHIEGGTPYIVAQEMAEDVFELMREEQPELDSRIPPNSVLIFAMIGEQNDLDSKAEFEKPGEIEITVYYNIERGYTKNGWEQFSTN